MLGLFTMLQAWLHTRFDREEGAVATEYALLIALVAIAIIGALIALGAAIAGRFFSVSGTLGGA